MGLSGAMCSRRRSCKTPWHESRQSEREELERELDASALEEQLRQLWGCPHCYTGLPATTAVESCMESLNGGSGRCGGRLHWRVGATGDPRTGAKSIGG